MLSASYGRPEERRKRALRERIGKTREGRVVWSARFGPQSQCRRARLRPPAVADRCSAPQNIGTIGRDFRIFQEQEQPLEEAFACCGQLFFEIRGRRYSSKPLLHAREPPFSVRVSARNRRPFPAGRPPAPGRTQSDSQTARSDFRKNRNSPGALPTPPTYMPRGAPHLWRRDGTVPAVLQKTAGTFSTTPRRSRAAPACRPRPFSFLRACISPA